MRLAIVGSRKLTTAQHATAGFVVSCVVNSYLYCHQYEYDFEIVSGGAPGVDGIAEAEAVVQQLPKSIFLPENEQWEPNGYKARNIEIAEYCDELVCIRARYSKSYGSGWTADYAESIGKLVRRIYV